MAKEMKNVASNPTTMEVSENVQTTPSVLVRLTNAFNEGDVPTVKLEDGTEIVQKKIPLLNAVGKKESITVYDADIITSINRIEGANKAKTITSYIICRELANIKKSGKLQKLGFDSIAQFAKAVFDFEPSTANHYANIGENFINPDYSVKAGLPDLSVSHFLELNKLVGENGDIKPIITLFTEGTLTDGMSTVRMRNVLKELAGGTALPDKSGKSSDDEKKSDNSQSSSSSADNSGNSSESPAVMETLAKEYDEKVAVAQLLHHSKSMLDVIGIMAENGANVEEIKKAVESVSTLAKKFV